MIFMLSSMNILKIIFGEICNFSFRIYMENINMF